MPSRREHQPERTAMDMVCRFNKLKSPKFEGGSNPLMYQEWLRKLENQFEIIECLERFKVCLAT